MVKAVLSGALKNVPMTTDPIFGISVPVSCPGVPSEILAPRKTWKDPAAYDKKARELAGMFERNFEENASDAPVEVREAGPGHVPAGAMKPAQPAAVLEPVHA
jgi:phosphoenolpyruvate carboxykinase (ATP)